MQNWKFNHQKKKSDTDYSNSITPHEIQQHICLMSIFQDKPSEPYQMQYDRNTLHTVKKHWRNLTITHINHYHQSSYCLLLLYSLFTRNQPMYVNTDVSYLLHPPPYKLSLTCFQSIICTSFYSSFSSFLRVLTQLQEWNSLTFPWLCRKILPNHLRCNNYGFEYF